MFTVEKQHVSHHCMNTMLWAAFGVVFSFRLSMFWLPALTHNVGRLCAGGGLAFRLPVAEVQFIDKCSLFVLLPNVIRHAQTAAAAAACT